MRGKGLGNINSVSVSLFELSKSYNVKLIEKAVKTRNVNGQDCYGYTALMWAVSYGNLEFVKEMVEKYNADFNTIKNESGITALDLAVRNEKTEIIEYFQKKIKEFKEISNT